MEINKKVILTALIIVLIVVVFYYIAYNITVLTGFLIADEPIRLSEFDRCLIGKRIILFINTDQTSEILREIKTTDYLKDLDIINCYRDKKICEEQSIKQFPTWIISGNKIERDITLSELSEFTKCKI